MMATPEPAYGVPTVSVVREGFCVPYPVELIVKRKTNGLSDTRFEVLDVNGNLFLQVDGTSLAFQCKRVMRNPAGFPILTLREKDDSVIASGMLDIWANEDLSVKWKIEKHRQKVLRVDSVLQKNPFVQAVPSSKSKPKKSIKKQKDVLKEKDATLDCPNDDSVIASGMLDIWANEGDNKSKKPSKTIRQTKVWISWNGGIDSKTKGAERRKQRFGMIKTVRIGKFRGPFQGSNGLKIDIIICFRKAQDEPYKCYEDHVLNNGLQHIQFLPFSLLRKDVSWTRAGHHGLDESCRAELRGPLQRSYGVGFAIIIYFRKAPDKPYICYEDFVG